MKIAIQLSGLPAEYNTTYRYLKMQLLDRLSNYHIYYTTWNTTSKKYIDLLNPYAINLLDYDEVVNNEYIKKDIEICTSKALAYYTKNKSTYLQFYQRRINNLLRQNSKENYDIVIMTRPDLVYVEPFQAEWLTKMLDDVNIPIGADFENGYNDLFAIANPQLMDKYNELQTQIRSILYEENTYYHPEHVLKMHLCRQKIPIKRFSYPFILRGTRLNF